MEAAHRTRGELSRLDAARGQVLRAHAAGRKHGGDDAPRQQMAPFNALLLQLLASDASRMQMIAIQGPGLQMLARQSL